MMKVIKIMRWERVMLVTGVLFLLFYGLGYAVIAAYESREFIDNCIDAQVGFTYLDTDVDPHVVAIENKIVEFRREVWISRPKNY